jgi:hypothetical protein
VTLEVVLFSSEVRSTSGGRVGDSGLSRLVFFYYKNTKKWQGKRQCLTFE